MSTPEHEAQSRFTWNAALVILIVLAAVFVLAREQYAHPQPAQDCSSAYDYPMCQRAAVPQPQPPPSMLSLYIGTLVMVLLAFILVWVSWEASVVRQAEIVTFVANTAPAKTPPASPTPAPQAPAQSAPSFKGVPQKTVLETEDDGQPKPAVPYAPPKTIINNDITPDMVVKPPKARPKEGVDPKLLEVKKDG